MNKINSSYNTYLLEDRDNYFNFLYLVVLVGIIFSILFPFGKSLEYLILAGLLFFLISQLLFPRILIALIIFSSYFYTPMTSSIVFGLNVHPVQFIVPIMSLSLLFRLMIKRDFQQLNLNVLFPVVIFLLSLTTSSLISTSSSKIFILSFQMWIAILAFFTVVYAIDNLQKFRYAWALMVFVGVFEGFLGVFSWLINYIFEIILIPNVVVYQNTYGFIPNGTWMETNIFADFIVPTIILLFVSLKIYTMRLLIIYCITVLIIGLLLSQTRGAWLSFIISIPLVYWQIQKLFSSKIVEKFKMLFLFTLLLSSIYFILTLIGFSDTFSERAISFSNLNEQSTFTGRLIIFGKAITDYLNGPIVFGYGSGSFSFRQISNTVAVHDWIGNIFIATLYEGGLIALLIFLYFLKNVFFEASKTIKFGTISNDKIRLFGLQFAAISIIISGQSNNHSWLPIFWIYFALLVAGTRIIKNNKPNIIQ